ncbi:germin-like protein [Vicia villosa]|uniref:germin-like protein n=1 Tax=Vicia villosa TaxID=3911 RepID=UPI00273AB749|nr:germin-like protein [Vicia villosa]
MKMNLIILFFFALFSSYTSQSNAFYANSNPDFCVADLSTPYTTSGYQCKSSKDVTVDDFVFSNFVTGKAIDPFNITLTVASVNNFPGLNGLDISAARVEVGANGTIAMHTHPDASELLIMVKGQLRAGFVTPNHAYVKDIKPGDVMAFPKGQVHFVVNYGVEEAVAFATYSSSNPSFQFLDHLLFANDLNSSMIAHSTLLGYSEIKRLKDVFGGSG